MSVEAVLGGLHRSIEAHASSGEFAVERSPDQLLLACNRLVETVIEVRCRPRTGLRADVYDEVTITSVLREVLPKISPHSLSNLNARARLCSIAQSEGGVLWAQSCFAWEEKSVGFVRSLPVRVIASHRAPGIETVHCEPSHSRAGSVFRRGSVLNTRDQQSSGDFIERAARTKIWPLRCG